MTSSESSGVSSALQQMIKYAQIEAFNNWAEKNTDLVPKGTNATNSPILFRIWCGGQEHRPPCRGVQHPGCNYLAPCGSICDKCGAST